MRTVAIVPAAGRGERMGADKALLDLAGTTPIERIAATCRAAGIDEMFVVRNIDASPLPAGLGARSVIVPSGGEMADSLRAANEALPAGTDAVVVFPVDHALVLAETVLALLALLQRPGCGIALPLFRERPGHPVAMTRTVFAEIDLEGTTLRDLVRADRTRVEVVPSANPWVLADLDRPEDLRAAVCALHGEPWSTLAQMFRHRSRRSYRPDPVPEAQINRLVDAARHASTSSFLQAYAVVAVRDQAIKAACARLCAGQRHIVEAPVFFAVCADLHKLAAACGRHGTNLQTQSFELFMQATVDAALFGQNLQLAAEAEGLGACMIGAARNHPIELAQTLGLPIHTYVVFGMTVGKAADDPVPRGRLPLQGVLHWDRYDPRRTDEVLDAADQAMQQWARATNAERGGYQGRPVNESKGWAERMATMWGAESEYAVARRELVSELRRLGFGLE
ncbi:MAG TPA: NTP transferase domain-containing protein [Planctomycetota bacterium]|nr:NTP transferase domain-containing protein [Planctomycetota bacterium]